MWGAIIGAAASLAAQGLGMAQSAEANREANEKLEAQQRENEAWYKRRYNEDPLQRLSSQRVLTQMSDMLRSSNKAAAGRNAVMGGTEEAVAAEKARNSQALAEAASRIAAQADAEKDAIEQQYRATKAGLTQQQIGVERQRAENIAAATAAAGQAIGKAGAAASGALDNGTKDTGGNDTSSTTEQKTKAPKSTYTHNTLSSNSVTDAEADKLINDAKKKAGIFAGMSRKY